MELPGHPFVRSTLFVALLASARMQESGGSVLCASFEDWLQVQAASTHPREKIVGLELGFLVRDCSRLPLCTYYFNFITLLIYFFVNKCIF